MQFLHQTARVALIGISAFLASAIVTTPTALARQAAAVASGDAHSEGDIRKVDKAGGQRTMRHAELTNLAMAALTMAFKVKHAAMLEQVTVADKVRFAAERGGGALTVMAIETAQ